MKSICKKNKLMLRQRYWVESYCPLQERSQQNQTDQKWTYFEEGSHHPGHSQLQQNISQTWTALHSVWSSPETSGEAEHFTHSVENVIPPCPFYFFQPQHAPWQWEHVALAKFSRNSNSASVKIKKWMKQMDSVTHLASSRKVMSNTHCV